MGEFKRGTLKSSSGDKVTDHDQAVAIALSEAREAGEDVPKKEKKANFAMATEMFREPEDEEDEELAGLPGELQPLLNPEDEGYEKIGGYTPRPATEALVRLTRPGIHLTRRAPSVSYLYNGQPISEAQLGLTNDFYKNASQEQKFGSSFFQGFFVGYIR
jgi:hypothetical protein